MKMPMKPVEDPTAEVITVVRKETCPHCKGNRFIAVTKAPNKDAWVKCPSCGGQGFRIRVTR